MTAGLWIVPGESADRLARVFLASFPSGPWQANCYVAATAAGRDCVIVDPGVGAADGLRRLVSAHDLTPAGVIAQYGGQGFGAFKPALADLAVSKLEPISAEMKRLMADTAELDRILGDGADRADAIAQPILERTYDIVGMIRSRARAR